MYGCDNWGVLHWERVPSHGMKPGSPHRERGTVCASCPREAQCFQKRHGLWSPWGVEAGGWKGWCDSRLARCHYRTADELWDLLSRSSHFQRLEIIPRSRVVVCKLEAAHSVWDADGGSERRPLLCEGLRQVVTTWLCLSAQSAGQVGVRIKQYKSTAKPGA